MVRLFFFNEPILTVTAPLIQGKILETPILNVTELSDTYSDGNIENYTGSQTQGSPVFGTRRASGFEAANVYGKSLFHNRMRIPFKPYGRVPFYNLKKYRNDDTWIHSELRYG